MRTERIFFALCVIIPVTVFVLAFGMISQVSGTINIWFLPVHEDGVRSFLNTVFFFEHALRELPLDILLGTAIGGVCAFCGGVNSRQEFPTRWIFFATLTAVFILAGSIVQVGWADSVKNLLQMHTRPGVPLLYGSHWMYHGLSRLALLILVFGIGISLCGFLGGFIPISTNRVRLPFAVFFVLLLGSSVYSQKFMQMFNDPVYLGHQAREVFTHVLTSVPIGFAACIYLMKNSSGRVHNRQAILGGIGIVFLSAMIAIYLGYASITAGSLDEGQSTDIRILVFPHFFEHSLGYVAIFLWAGAIARIPVHR